MISAPVTDRRDRRVQRCRRKFLEFFPDGFHDATYLETERSYKWLAHRDWTDTLAAGHLEALLRSRDYDEVARRAVRLEARTNLLFSFEKMALRDAVSRPEGAHAFATGLHQWLYGSGSERTRFEQWVATVAGLPRRQTRVATWPVITIFGFLARPKVHLYLKPTVTRLAAEAYGFELDYSPRPGWATYASVQQFARTVRRDLADLRPRDMIDIQSFLWVQGSAEYDL